MDRPRVLIVDSSEISHALVDKVLGRHCDLLFQTQPLMTFDALELFEPDLLIVDLDLPCLSGFELIDLIHTQPQYVKLPIMVFSERHDVESQKLAYRLGAMHFQCKPCKPSQLFKGAAMFARLAGGERPPKQLSPTTARAQLAERQAQHQCHPLLTHALSHQGRVRHREPQCERSLLATVAAATRRSG